MSGLSKGLSIIVGLLFFSGMMTAFGWFFLIDQGELGLVLRYGAIVREAGPGLNWKAPWIESVEKMSLRTEKITYGKDKDAKVSAYSKDIQGADLVVTVNFRLDPNKVSEVYSTYRTDFVNRLITPRTLDEIKTIFGRFNAKAAIEERGRLGMEMEAAVKKSVEGTGIIIDGLLLQDIDFSKAFEDSVEERMRAEVEVLKFQQNLEREKTQADIKRTQAAGSADALRAQARAEADAILMRAEAEAKSIKLRSDALAQNPMLIELIKAERWNGSVPSTMIPGAAIPFIGVPK